jgi:alkaline phosphatase D
MPHPEDRRQFVFKLAALSAALVGGAALSGCGDGDDEQADFLYGVASGDPLADRVILWTHARYPDSDEHGGSALRGGRRRRLRYPRGDGQVTASSSTGYTAKVDAAGLAPGRSYYYRFTAGATRSPVGQTRTLPATAAEVKFAVLSCANYPAGYFNVYAEVARSDAQFALHLGDYLYEYDAAGYASAGAAALGRISQPTNELLTLADYRLRYAQYRSDADSKTLHARMPMIAVWDDHEVANDAWKDGAENHSPATEGSWAARRAVALQAYHEWMPIRTGADPARIYRSFDFGSLVSLHMLDTRLLGRDRQIDIAELAGLAGPTAQAAATVAFSSPTRQMLGSEQLAWLQGRMAASNATWQVLGQQVLMARMEFPVSVLAALNSSDTSPAAQAAGAAAVTDYLTAKATPAALRTPAQAALMNPALNPLLGYNLDAWDGYLAARETLLGTALQLGKKLVSLAGDTHNAWHASLTLKGLANPALAGVKVGEEFATSSVSSPGLESYLALPPCPGEGHLRRCRRRPEVAGPFTPRLPQDGFTATEAKGEWVFVDTIANRSYQASVGHTATYGV